MKRLLCKSLAPYILGLTAFFGTIAPGVSDDDVDMASIKATLKAGQCPAREISLINVDERCGGITYRRACDQKYSISSGPWQECYHEQKLCQDQVSDDNQVIIESNRAYHRCPEHQADEQDYHGKAAVTRSRGTPASNSAEERDKQSEQPNSEAALERAQERSRFDLAQKMDSLAGWRAFLKQYPEGVDAEWAKKRITELSVSGYPENETSAPPRPSSSSQHSAGEFVGKILLNIRADTDKTLRSYFDGKLTGTKTIHTSGGFPLELTMGQSQAVYAEVGKPKQFVCGGDQYRTSSFSDNKYGYIQVRCKFSRNESSITFDLQTEQKVFPSGHTDQPGIGRMQARLSVVIVGQACRVVNYSLDSSTRNPMFIHYDSDAHTQLSSADCQLE